jgi:hypothetical protein
MPRSSVLVGALQTDAPPFSQLVLAMSKAQTPVGAVAKSVLPSEESATPRKFFCPDEEGK